MLWGPRLLAVQQRAEAPRRAAAGPALAAPRGSAGAHGCAAARPGPRRGAKGGGESCKPLRAAPAAIQRGSSWLREGAFHLKQLSIHYRHPAHCDVFNVLGTLDTFVWKAMAGFPSDRLTLFLCISLTFAKWSQGMEKYIYTNTNKK